MLHIGYALVVVEDVDVELELLEDVLVDVDVLDVVEDVEVDVDVDVEVELVVHVNATDNPFCSELNSAIITLILRQPRERYLPMRRHGFLVIHTAEPYRQVEWYVQSFHVRPY